MYSSDIFSEKQRLRAYYKEKRKQIPCEVRELSDAALCENILALPCIKSARTVLVFYPVKNEPDIRGLSERLLAMGKQIAFPISHSESCTLTFKYVNDMHDMVIGTYNIPEPSVKAKTVEDFSDCVCIVPALVFDRQGYRLGYGKGYYDRFLKDFGGVSVGVAYSQFLVERLPHDKTDLTVDLIITERGSVIPYEQQSEAE